MSNKPLKRNINIQPLSRDHHGGLLFCWKIRRGVQLGADTSRMREYVGYFWDHHMKPHFREEEEILFAGIEDELVQKAISDHRSISDQIAQIVSAENISSDRLLQLAGTVDDHIRYEERQLFPHLETTLSEQQLEQIGNKLNNNPDEPDNYHDSFWLISTP